MDNEQLQEFTADIRRQIHQVVMGQDDAIDLMLCALLSAGHVLLEGVPGTAKTLLARSFATTLSLDFKRIQFTPDLMPGDVIGTNLFSFQTSTFTLTKGPIFTDILLADEINRTPPKTQAALLEAMQERSVTIDGKTHSLGDNFMVIATQNPIEQQGTYPLPEAQLDRFLFKVLVDYPTEDQEKEMVMLHGHSTVMPTIQNFDINTISNSEKLLAARKFVSEIRLNEDLVDYIIKLVRTTRESTALVCGASPRAANMIAVASRAWAALHGRDFVIPDDIKELTRPILRHRLPLTAGAEIEGSTVELILEEILDQVPVPR